MQLNPPTEHDLKIVGQQLGREPRGIVSIAWRCPCGEPGVVMTAPRLDNGTPFPTTYYLTNPQAVKGCSTLEANGVMLEMNQRLTVDTDLAAQYGPPMMPIWPTGWLWVRCRKSLESQQAVCQSGLNVSMSWSATRWQWAQASTHWETRR